MSKESSTAISIAQSITPDRAMGQNELIVRMAEDLRLKSGSDLPLSCFVEQVKMQLAGRARSANANAASLVAGRSQADRASDLFKAWAMPE